MPARRIAGTAAEISPSEAKGASAIVWWLGRGDSFSVASVTTASVPSEPMISWVRS